MASRSDQSKTTLDQRFLPLVEAATPWLASTVHQVVSFNFAFLVAQGCGHPVENHELLRGSGDVAFFRIVHCQGGHEFVDRRASDDGFAAQQVIADRAVPEVVRSVAEVLARLAVRMAALECRCRANRLQADRALRHHLDNRDQLRNGDLVRATSGDGHRHRKRLRGHGRGWLFDL